jgi:hypothetical protein
MKTFQMLFACLFLFAGVGEAQKSTVKTSAFKVWGNCGMCKTTIEGAAKNSGATYADWDVESKMLTVKYAAAKTNDEKIQKGIANAGYDNVKFTAPDAVYEGLPECCRYDRKTADVNSKGEKGEKGSKDACCTKDGKCVGGKDCCKKAEGKSDCCTTGKCAEAGGCCAGMKCEKSEGCCKKEGSIAKADCCKGGSCSHK